MKAVYFAILASLFLSSTGLAASVCVVRLDPAYHAPRWQVICDDNEGITMPVGTSKTKVLQDLANQRYRIVAVDGGVVYLQC